MQNYSKAHQDFEKAFELAPGNPFTTQQFAWSLATHADEDVRDAEQALTLIEQLFERADWQEFYFLETHAAALAANQQFEKAVEVQERAMDMYEEENDEDASEEMEARLTLYQQNKPFLQQDAKLYDDN